MVKTQDGTTGKGSDFPDAVADFEHLLDEYDIKKAPIIAKNMSETGGATIFDDPAAMAKKLAKWPRDIAPVYREQILEHWFSSRGISIPEGLIEEVGLEKGEKDDKDKQSMRKKKLSEGAVWTVEVDSAGVPRIRMIKGESEPGITLEDAKIAAKEIAKEGQEPITVFNEQMQKHMPNFKSPFVKQNLSAAWTVAKQMDKSMAEGEELDPIELWIDMETKKQQLLQVVSATGGEVKAGGTISELIQGLKDLKAMAGEGKVELPDWMTDPVKFIATVQTVTGAEKGAGARETPEWMSDPVKFIATVQGIIGSSRGDEAVNAQLTELKKSLDEMKEQRYLTQITAQQDQIKTLTGKMDGLTDMITDLKRPVTGMTEMDILSKIATEGISLAKVELPGLRSDLRDALQGGVLPSSKTPQEREERKQRYHESLEKDKDIEDLGKRLFLPET